MNKKAYAFFLKKNRPRNPVAQVLKFFTPQVIKDKKKYRRKEKHVQKNFWSIRNVRTSD